ncbi:hypothetical protein [Campylobacter corcagiensis]|uniref:Uncharacterized protein n=2 Tax=Campylobacter corcagiensis TaxID=1448857 RepID=A0A7M1LF24_9BACT|nr:hypothetical protein [Campylobacter corcagiensis]QKF64647.1 hypothetical protein CCORG_0790 [Campylobacter corcagiensis]QOQ87182.1 hypothetical protein IMC76_08225 [Campylobacter corcagiensis]
MALPFVAGLAVGSLAVVAFNNKDKIKEKLSQGYQKGKEVAQDLKEYTEEKLKSSKDECCNCTDEKLDGCECECHDEDTQKSKASQAKKNESKVESKRPSTRTKKTTNKGE